MNLGSRNKIKIEGGVKPSGFTFIWLINHRFPYNNYLYVILSREGVIGRKRSFASLNNRRFPYKIEQKKPHIGFKLINTTYYNVHLRVLRNWVQI